MSSLIDDVARDRYNGEQEVVTLKIVTQAEMETIDYSQQRINRNQFPHIIVQPTATYQRRLRTGTPLPTHLLPQSISS